MSSNTSVSGLVTLQEIIIDEEFKRLLPPLDEQTFLSLEQSIFDYGCMNPLVLWNNILIDGYNRYTILMKYNLPFSTVNMEFESRDQVLIWIISTQVSRRNLTAMQLTYFRGLHYNTEKKLHGDINRTRQNPAKGQNDLLQGSTANRLSGQYNVSPKTIKRDGEIAEVISAIGRESPDAKKEILAGTTRISRRHLRELASGLEEDIVNTAAKIESGTFEASLKPANPGQPPIKNPDNSNLTGSHAGSNLSENAETIKSGIYRHYKGNMYQVTGLAKHSETLEEMVVYTALYGGNETWVRPLSMWNDLVDIDGSKVKRFEYKE